MTFEDIPVRRLPDGPADNIQHIGGRRDFYRGREPAPKRRKIDHTAIARKIEEQLATIQLRPLAERIVASGGSIDT